MMVELLLLVLLFFILGASVGSFLTVVIDRFQQQEQLVKGRSHCDHCKHTLGILDLIPVFSFLFLRGRCRYCHKKLSVYYPSVEIVTGALFLGSFLFFQSSLFTSTFSVLPLLTLLYFLILVSICIIIFFSDMKYGIIPLPAVAIGTASAFFYQLFFSPADLINHFVSAIISCLFLFSIFFFTRGRGLGFGDVLYGFFMGAVLGFPQIISGYYLAFLTGAAVSLILILSKRKKMRGSTIPFGPFLVLGTIINLFFGREIIAFVLSYFS